MLIRVLEPEAMDTAAEAADYDAMDHSAVNRAFTEDFLSHGEPAGPVLDVGTGTALIPIELCRQSAAIEIVAVDLAEAMLVYARRNVEAAGFARRIRLELVNARGLPYDDGHFAAVVSNSIIHHIPEPFDCFVEMVRVCRPGGMLFVRDLFRPDSEAALQHLVQLHAGDANDHQRQLFTDSLQAALTVDEVRVLLGKLGFAAESIRATSDRHWTFHAIRH